jgi:phosphoribosylamine-glycine ligase
MRCQIAGHRVLWWDKPQENGKPRRAGEGLVPKIKDFNEIKSKWLDAADLIYVPDNVKYIDMLEPYRLRGYPIFNANMDAAKLEIDREAGQAAMRKGGIATIPSKTFHDYKDAIRYVEKEGKAFVSKPSGDADKALSYVARDAADMIFMLERWDKNPEYRKMARKDGFIIQEKIDGIEMAVGGYFGPHGWNEIFFENFEYKKLMTGDLGVNCYSEDTEVLTSAGWKFWPDVTMDDEICTLRDGNVEFERPSLLTVGDDDKELIGWQSPYVDILVTPGHNMYVQDTHARKPFYFEPANVTELNNRHVLISHDVGVPKTKMYANLTPDMTYRQPYSGKVYCCTVTSHIIYVRRNGKACFLGQTGEMGTAVRPTKRSKLADMVLKPFTDQLHAMGYVGFVDNAVMIGKTDGKIYPLEFTISRDGWPIRHNIQSLLALDLDPAQWMLDLINGVDSLRVRDGMTSISVVVPLPPFPYQHVVGKDLDGIPLYNATDMMHVHLSEARLDKDVPVMVDGKVVRQPNLVATDVYPLVVTGVGKTINKARNDAYAAVKVIEIPNSPFYRTDIGNGRLTKQLPILKRHGFAKDWTM